MRGSVARSIQLRGHDYTQAATAIWKTEDCNHMREWISRLRRPQTYRRSSGGFGTRVSVTDPPSTIGFIPALLHGIKIYRKGTSRMENFGLGVVVRYAVIPLARGLFYERYTPHKRQHPRVGYALRAVFQTTV